jgi:catechol 2,3-dioxygenase-like lactoylglutathione lyase family enzyme
MSYELGALVDHINVRVADFEASRRFYLAALAAIGRPIESQDDHHLGSGELYVTAAGDAPTTSGLHLAFQAADRAAVDRFHADALAAGGTDNGGPGIRDRYAANYYGAFVLDPDGNNIEAVVHEGERRSAPSVEVFTD